MQGQLEAAGMDDGMRRVVITGLGMVSPLACGVEATWARLLAGRSGAGTITKFDASHLPATVACEVPLGDGSDGTFNADDWVAPKDQRKIDTFILYALAAAEQAVTDADWKPEDEESRLRTGVMIGSGIGGLQTIAEAAVTLKEKGHRRISPFFIPGSLINLCSGQVSIRYGFKGPNHAVVTACSTGRACHRRRVAADPARRRRRDGGGRGRGGDLRAGHRRFRGLQGAVDEFQRDAGAGEPAL
jgi:3-oxoacyl-[acyl-carrier-protein] synthase II